MFPITINVVFFENRPAQEKMWTKKLWVYNLRTNMHFTLKTNPLRRSDLDEFVTLYKPEDPRETRRENWSQEEGKRGKSPEGRWRSFTYDEIIKRDKATLDIIWLKDDSLEDSENLPDPEVHLKDSTMR